MPRAGWWSTLRLYVSLRRDVRRIADALERIADAQEGYPRANPAADRPEARPDPLTVSRDLAIDFARVDALRQQYIGRHGYEPSDEELAHLVDEVPWSTDEIREHQARFTRPDGRPT